MVPGWALKLAYIHTHLTARPVLAWMRLSDTLKSGNSRIYFFLVSKTREVSKGRLRGIV